MAFVSRSNRILANELVPNSHQQVGPGSYIQINEYKIKKSYAPFNQSSFKNKEKPNQDDNNIISPGPGQYQLQKGNGNERVIAASANEDIKIVEIPKQQCMFKSSSNRFPQKKLNDVPGPGSYDNNLIETKNQKKAYINNPQKKIMEALIKINRYQSIPSIPSNTNAFGYTENQSKELELNQPPIKVYSGKVTDCVGPGNYEIKNVFDVNKEKGTEWYKYQPRDNQLKQKQKSMTTFLGPGTYDVNKQYNPLYKNKQTSGFASKTQRQPDQKKLTQFLKDKLTQSQSNKFINNGAKIIKDEDIQNIEEYIPAPGQYYNEKTFSSLKLRNKPEKFQFFGSSADRFGYRINQNNVGPGLYNLAQINSQQKTDQNINPAIKIRAPPFLSSNTRFDTNNQMEVSPGPCQYNAKQSLEEKLIKKIQKGYIGSFGSYEQRFMKQNVTFNTPGPGSYIEPIQEIQPEQQHSPTVNFKSQVSRCINQKKLENMPPVGAYEVQNFDIKTKTKMDVEQDLEFQIKKAPFNSSEPRFKLNLNKSQEEEEEQKNEDEKLSQRQKSFTLLSKKQSNKNVPFNVKDSRFRYDKQEKKALVGPGQYYDPKVNIWNKKTYNILFAQI